jgi:hypothetical protein
LSGKSAQQIQKRDLNDFVDVAEDSESEKNPFHFIQLKAKLNAAGTHESGNHTHHFKGNHTHTGAGKGGKGGKWGKQRHGGHKATTLSA